MSDRFIEARYWALFGATAGCFVGLLGFVPLVIFAEATLTPPLKRLENFGQIGMAGPIPAMLVAISASFIGLLAYLKLSVVCLAQIGALLVIAVTKTLLLPTISWDETTVVATGLLLVLPIFVTLMVGSRIRSTIALRLARLKGEPPIIAG